MSDPTHLSLLSPDRRVEVRFTLGEWCADSRKHPGAPLWQVWYDGRQMLRWSRVGTGTQNYAGSMVDKVPDKDAVGFEVTKITRHRIRRTWQPEHGDAAELRDHANELIVRLQERAEPARRVELIFRCADEGAAMRVRVPRQRGLKEVVAGGAAGVLRFPEGTLAWVSAGGKIPVDELKAACTMPLLLNFAHGKIAVAAATGGDGQLAPTRDGLAVQADATPATVKLPYGSAWQVVLLGDSPCGVMQNRVWLQSMEKELALRGGAPAAICELLVPLQDAATPAHLAARALVRGEGAARWDETRWLRGAFGEFAVVARRLGRVWQVAGITGAEGRVLTVRLEGFLADRTYTTNRAYGSYSLQILRDPLPGEPAADGLVRESFAGVDCLDKPRLELSPHGGFVLRLEPEPHA